MFQQITTTYNIYNAYKKTLRGQAKFKVAAIRFSEHETRNLNALLNEIINETYRPEAYVNFTIHEPKERNIHAPCYRDKIVQHMVNNIIAPYFKRRFIFDSYACIVGKGNQRAIARLQHYMRKNQWENPGTGYIVKVDISRFFKSIDRVVLKKILTRHIPCTKTLRLLFIIIDNAPEENGLPLGNLTSQVFANVYMNELDQYVKRVLRVKYYVRYADDIFVFVKDKSTARALLKQIECFVGSKLNLVIHPYKSTIVRPYAGLDALGFKIFTTHILLKYDTKVRIRKRLRHIPKMVNKGVPVFKIEQSLNSWYSFAKSAKIRNFINHLKSEFSFLYQDDQGLLRISPNELAPYSQ